MTLADEACPAPTKGVAGVFDTASGCHGFYVTVVRFAMVEPTTVCVQTVAPAFTFMSVGAFWNAGGSFRNERFVLGNGPSTFTNAATKLWKVASVFQSSAAAFGTAGAFFANGSGRFRIESVSFQNAASPGQPAATLARAAAVAG